MASKLEMDWSGKANVHEITLEISRNYRHFGRKWKSKAGKRMRQRKRLRRIAIVFERISGEFLIKAFFNAIICEGEQTVASTLTNNIVDGSQALNNNGEGKKNQQRE